MGNLWLRCEIQDGPDQTRRVSEVREIAHGLCGEDGHVYVEGAPGRVFCDVHYEGPKSLVYLVSALYIATGEQFRRQGLFASKDTPWVPISSSGSRSAATTWC